MHRQHHLEQHPLTVEDQDEDIEGSEVPGESLTGIETEKRHGAYAGYEQTEVDIMEAAGRSDVRIQRETFQKSD